MNDPHAGWPALDYSRWAETLMTFRLWVQMVGKVRLAHEPWLNHSWHVPLYVSANGLTTSVVHADGRSFEIEFDLAANRLILKSSAHPSTGFALEPMTVAEFHSKLVRALEDIGVDARFDGSPNEISGSIPFAQDHVHASYDAAPMRRFHCALLSIDRVFKRFRTAFIGKVSPVHLFWGSFDLAVTRFSGRGAPMHPGGVPALPDAVTREAYDQEVSSAGFWPGDENHPEAAFYSYAYPAPEGFANAAVEPVGAAFSHELGEWLLPYETVRQSSDPGETLMSFLQSTFEAAAWLADWNRGLECAPGRIGVPRTIVPMV
jgi:hypothetical protein